MSKRASTTELRAFGDMVRNCRQDVALTQDELAEASGLSQPTISMYECGRLHTLPSLDSLRRLAHGLQISVDTLFEAAIVDLHEGYRNEN